MGEGGGLFGRSASQYFADFIIRTCKVLRECMLELDARVILITLILPAPI